MIKEYKLLNGMKVTGALDPNTMTPEQKLKALHEINTIKENCCIKINGITRANRRPQQKYIMKEDVTSLTKSQEALMGSLIQDVHEG